MPTTRRRRTVVGQFPPPPTATGNTSTVPSAPNLPAARSLKKELSSRPVSSPSLPLNHPLQPPLNNTNKCSAGAHPQSTGTIPSDTTEWDPTMVSPAQRDPSYNPTAAIAAIPPNTKWGSSPAPHLQGQGSAVNINSGLSGEAGAPALGLFPVLDPNLQLTILHPIPLKLPRSRSFTETVTTNNNSADITSRLNHEPLGRDIPSALQTMTSSRPKRVKRSVTSIQPTNVPSYQQHVPSTTRAQSLRRSVMLTTNKLSLKRKSASIQGSRLNVESSPVNEREEDLQLPQQSSGDRQTGQDTQPSIGSSWTLVQGLEQQDKAEKYREPASRETPSPTTKYITAPSTPIRMSPPMYLERVPEVPPTIPPASGIPDLPSPTANQFETAELQLYPDLSMHNPIVDTTNPNFGTLRPGAEISGAYDDPSWACNLLERPPKLCQREKLTPEPETLYGSDEGGETLDVGGKFSGATPTSYSQRPGSPSSLIGMYRVHADTMVNKKRRGMSLVHTKMPYIGESMLLDLDMPETGEVMDMEEMELLMDEMIDSRPGKVATLASIEKDREIQGQCMKALRYTQWS